MKNTKMGSVVAFAAVLTTIGCAKNNNEPIPNPAPQPSRSLDVMAEEKDQRILKRDAIWRKFNKNKLGLTASLDSNGGEFSWSQPASTHECRLQELSFVCDPDAPDRYNRAEIKKIYEVCIPLEGTYQEATELRAATTQRTIDSVLEGLSEFGDCEYKKPDSVEPGIIWGPINALLDSTVHETNYTFLDLDIPPSVVGSLQNKRDSTFCKYTTNLAHCLSMPWLSCHAGKTFWHRNSTSIPYTCTRLKESFEILGGGVSYFSKDLNELWQIFGCETLI